MRHRTRRPINKSHWKLHTKKPKTNTTNQPFSIPKELKEIMSKELCKRLEGASGKNAHPLCVQPRVQDSTLKQKTKKKQENKS